jgi:hypothetical protein
MHWSLSMTTTMVYTCMKKDIILLEPNLFEGNLLETWKEIGYSTISNIEVTLP